MTTRSSDAPNPGSPVLAAMVNPVKDYDWGSTSMLAALQGRAADGGPEAELWMGAHPSAPSAVLAADGGEPRPLPDVVTAAPEQVLGADVCGRFGPRLPFMLKVLCIERPLSVQVHPDAVRAREVFDPAGGSPYVDPHHKPELLYALEPVQALYGLRPAAHAHALFEALDRPEFDGILTALTGAGDESGRLHAAFGRLVSWPVHERADLVRAAAEAAEHLPGRVHLPGAVDGAERTVADAAHWVAELAHLHPADPLVLAPLLLDVIRLAPGEAVFVPAGVPHAYLSGCGVEILAASDNVVRAGLTHKPIATEELLEIVDCRPIADCRAPAEPLGAHEVAWQPPVPDFRLTRLRVGGDDPAPLHPVPGPQILLCTRGKVTVQDAAGLLPAVTLPAGQSAFAGADAGPLTVSGDGEVFRAAVGAV